MRVGGWEEALLATVGRHMETPFKWHDADCVALVRDTIKAVTGKDPLNRLKEYRDAKEARRVLKSGFGHNSLAEAFDRRFPEIPVAMAGRGDIAVLIDDNGAECAVVCLGMDFVGKSEKGVVRTTRARIKRAWRIE